MKDPPLNDGSAPYWKCWSICHSAAVGGWRLIPWRKFHCKAKNCLSNLFMDAYSRAADSWTSPSYWRGQATASEVVRFSANSLGKWPALKQIIWNTTAHIGAFMPISFHSTNAILAFFLWISILHQPFCTLVNHPSHTASDLWFVVCQHTTMHRFTIFCGLLLCIFCSAHWSSIPSNVRALIQVYHITIRSLLETFCAFPSSSSHIVLAASPTMHVIIWFAYELCRGCSPTFATAWTMFDNSRTPSSHSMS